jgi:hypothetical protein
MKGTLDLKNEDEWLVRYRIEEASGVIVYNSIPLSRFNKIMYKNQLYINGEVEFNIIKENNHISYCTCSDKQYNDCEYFVKSGINECMNYENIEVEVAKTHPTSTVQSLVYINCRSATCVNYPKLSCARSIGQ